MKKGVIVLDIGKTSAKVSYIDTDGHVVGRWERPNASVTMDGLMRLDAVGIESWLGGAIAEMARVGEVGAIVPVAHGAAAAILRGNVLAMPPLDYEQEIPADLSSEYRSQRDPFAMTGSPALPNGLNLGTQLHLLEKRYPDLLSPDATILTWPQYWAWRLGAGAACELTSLGCHSDLWWPTEGKPSALATRRGWAARLAPIRGASEVLGHLSAEWIKRTGLPASTEIRCGLHDSNAALVAMRDSTATDEFTLLSTGTWFIAMRSPGVDAVPCLADLDERRDCLVNIDTRGHLIPSSRFMGGREIQLLLEEDGIQIDDPGIQDLMIGCVQALVSADSMVLPSMVAGVGPFPHLSPHWCARPALPIERAAGAALYAALVARTSLDLIGARERIVVEGRFAKCAVFVQALASLLAPARVSIGAAASDLAIGAARLVNARNGKRSWRSVPNLATSLVSYQARWRERIRTGATQ